MIEVLRKTKKAILDGLKPRIVQIPVKVPLLQTELLKNRTALITGATRGIGFAIAEAFSRAGANVIVAGRDGGRVKSAVAMLQESGQTASGIILDVRNVPEFAKSLSGLPPFDILVNNAGFVGGGGFWNTTEDEYDLVLDTNLKGHYFLSQFVAKDWVSKGVKGNILNVCSASSLRPGTSPYIISKWGMRSLTVGMAKQLVKYGIVVNGIAPGVTNTDRFTHGTEDISKSSNPSGRMVTMDEIANMAVILASPLCRMVVGDILYMTGGGGIVTLDD